MKHQHIAQRFLNEFEVAELLGLSAKTLRRWRLFGRGPKFRRFGGAQRGAVRYDIADIESWVAKSPAGGDGVRL